MRKFVRENGLTLFFAAIFLIALAGQALTGHADHNNQLMTDGVHPISLLRYLTSSEFAVDVAFVPTSTTLCPGSMPASGLLPNSQKRGNQPDAGTPQALNVW